MLSVKTRLCVFLLCAGSVMPVLAQDSANSGAVAPPATITGSGTLNFVSKFTGASTIGNSAIFESGGKIGMGTSSPAVKLDVKGKVDVRDTLDLLPSGTHPTLTVDGTAFSVSNTGKVTFISGQNFPGTVTHVTAGTGLSGGGTGSTTLSLNTGFTDGRYPQLATSNFFTTDQSFGGNIFLTGFLSSGDIFSLDMFPSTVNPFTADARAVQADNNGGTQTVEMQNFTTGFGFIEAQFNSTGTATFFTDNAGDTTAIGTKSAAVPLTSGKMVKVFSMESPEVWFEDFGSGRVMSGIASVTLDDRFLQTVDVKGGYHVFLTPKGDCKGLYIANESATGFDVREMGGGQATVDFDYRIVAHRAKYAKTRLPAAVIPRVSQASRPVRPTNHR
jgi:hypothetical protein